MPIEIMTIRSAAMIEIVLGTEERCQHSAQQHIGEVSLTAKIGDELEIPWNAQKTTYDCWKRHEPHCAQRVSGECIECGTDGQDRGRTCHHETELEEDASNLCKRSAAHNLTAINDVHDSRVALIELAKNISCVGGSQAQTNDRDNARNESKAPQC